jgi:hypothetical protein
VNDRFITVFVDFLGKNKFEFDYGEFQFLDSFSADLKKEEEEKKEETKEIQEEKEFKSSQYFTSFPKFFEEEASISATYTQLF